MDTDSNTEILAADVAESPETPAVPAASVTTAEPVQTFQQRELMTDVVRRKLRGRLDEFAQALGARLTVYTQLDVSVSVTGLKTISFQKFVENTSTPMHMTLFKLEPLRGIGLLEIPPSLGLPIVDRQLGGAGKVEKTDRPLTDIETALLDQVSDMVLADWCAPLSDLQSLTPSVLGHEMDVRFLNAVSRETTVLELTFELRLGETAGAFRIGFPYDNIEHVLRKLGDSTPAASSPPAASSQPSSKWNPLFDDVPVSLTAVCDGLRLTARQVASLQVGDTVPVGPDRIGDIKLRVGPVSKFCGVLGSNDGRWAVQLTKKLEC
jgi:flagellar motor switch protein FliM